MADIIGFELAVSVHLAYDDITPCDRGWSYTFMRENFRSYDEFLEKLDSLIKSSEDRRSTVLSITDGRFSPADGKVELSILYGE